MLRHDIRVGVDDSGANPSQATAALAASAPLADTKQHDTCFIDDLSITIHDLSALLLSAAVSSSSRQTLTTTRFSCFRERNRVLMSMV